MPGHTFRVFVSSTFSDLKQERNALARWVFPRLRELCEKRSYKFQAVDLRWGVREEAALDQQTVRICLDEIARCQRLSPRPNFIVLLGDRYGWCPPPSVIPATEWHRLLPHVSAEDRQLLEYREGADPDEQGWYRRDDNAVPEEYVLQPRRGPFVEYAMWEPVERRLRKTLARAAESAGLGDTELLKYRASATELEIIKGAVQAPDAREHVFAFFRKISNLDTVKAALPGKSAADFVDTLSDGSWDKEAWDAQQRLKELVRDQLGEENIWPYEGHWKATAGGLDFSTILGELPTEAEPPPAGAALAETKSLCEAVWQRLSRVITTEMEALDRQALDPLKVEKQTHKRFAEERRRVFVGRREPLARIADYLDKGGTRPLVVHGPSGSGKSALMARAEADAQAAHPKAIVMERFIGATPGSSEVRSLLEGLCQEVSRAYGADEDPIVDYPKLVAELPKRLALATADRPLILFLDALDQLGDTDDGRRLVWLPRELPPHVRVVLSTLEEEKYQCFPVLRAGARNEDLLRVTPLRRDEGREILLAWLKDETGKERPQRAPRALTSQQLDVLLEKFAIEGSPLYLKLAFEAARRWRSYESDAPATALPQDIPGLIRALLERLSVQHGDVVLSSALGYLAAARYGLNDEEMLELLWRNPKVREDFEARKHHDIPEENPGLPRVIWSRLYFDLEPYLSEREIFGVRLISFYHRQLAEVAEQEYVAPRRKGTHTELSDYFAERWSRPDTHALLELIGQLARADRGREAREVLLQYDWLEKKLAATNIHVLLGDYDELQLDRQEPAGLVGGALRLSSHVLAVRPEELAAQLLGRMLDFEEPEIRDLLADARLDFQPPTLVPVRRSLDAPGGPLLRTLEGHESYVSSVAIAPDGRIAVSASGDRTLKVWDITTGRLLRTLEGHVNSVHGVAIAPDGRIAVSASSDRTLRVWNLTTGRLLRTLDSPHGTAFAVAIASDGRTAVAGSGRTVEVWDLASGRLVHALEDHPAWAHAIAIASESHIAVSASPDRTLKVWDFTAGTLLRTLEGHRDSVSDVAIAADGLTAISASNDKTLKMWDLASGKILGTLEGHQRSVSDVAITPNGRTAISASGDMTLKVWDLPSGNSAGTLEGHQDTVWGVAITPDGRTAVSASGDTTLKVWDLTSSARSRRLKGHKKWVDAIATTPDGRTAVSASGDTTLKVWDLPSDTLLRTLEGHQGGVSHVAIAPNGRIAISASGDTTLKVWDLPSGVLLCTLKGHQDRVSHVAVTPDGHTAISTSVNLMSYDTTVKVWDVVSGRLLHTLEGHRDGVHGVAITPDGRTVVSASRDKTLKVWDVASGHLLHTLEGHDGIVSGVAIPADGRTALSASSDKTLKVWDLASGKSIATLGGHQALVSHVVIAPHGRTAVSASHDRTLKVWDLASASLRNSLRGHQDLVQDVTISPDGHIAVSSSDDRTLKMWDLESGALLASFTADATLHCAAIVSDGQRVVAGDHFGRVHVFDIPLESLAARDQAMGGQPDLKADHNEAARRNAEYQQAFEKWKQLPFWKRAIMKKPKPPKGI